MERSHMSEACLINTVQELFHNQMPKGDLSKGVPTMARPLHKLVARLVEDAVRFSSMKRKMLDWQGESKKMRQRAAEELLCSGIMKAAVEKSKEDQGGGFTLKQDDLRSALGLDETVFNNLFSVVADKKPCESEILQRFARSFGYLMSVKKPNGQPLAGTSWSGSCTLNVVFTPHWFAYSWQMAAAIVSAASRVYPWFSRDLDLKLHTGLGTAPLL